MIRITDRSHFFSMERIMFPAGPVSDSSCDLIRYMRFPEPQTALSGAISDIAYTYWTDLRPSPEEISAAFSKTIRYELRRSERDAITLRTYDCAFLQAHREVLADFRATYMHFCDVCGNEELKAVYDDAFIQACIDSGHFLLTAAEFGHGKVYHAYFLDAEQVCLWYSASDFRNEQVDRNLAARANKKLHYADMLTLKARGVARYDWGNVSTRYNEHPNGIDTFKASFGGTYAEVYSYTVGNTLLGRLLVLGKKLLGRLQHT